MGIRTDNTQFKFLRKLFLSTSFTYLLLTLPKAIYNVTSFDMNTRSQWLWSCIADYLTYINHSVNLILYFISGKTVRDEVKSMLACKKNYVSSEIEDRNNQDQNIAEAQL